MIVNKRCNFVLSHFTFLLGLGFLLGASVQTRAAELPDLVITSIAMSPPNPVPGQAVTFTAVVKNQGPAPTPADVEIGCGFYVDGVDVASSWSDRNALEAGASVTLTSGDTWTATNGKHVLVANVNDVERFPEVTYSNNTFTFGFEILQDLPDLIVTAISMSPPNPSPGQPVTFAAVVKNQGPAPTPADVEIGCGFYVDGVDVASSWSDTTALEPGATVTLTSGDTWAAKAGSHTLVANVNNVQRFPEITFANNTLSSPFTIALAPTLATISIGTALGNTIPDTFMGLSSEWSQANVMGNSTTGVNTVYRQLLNNLTAYGSKPVMIRIGGESTDDSGPPTSTTTQAFSELYNALGVKFTLGVNLGLSGVANKTPDLAVQQTQAFVKQMPAGSLVAIEIGNEPNEYGKGTNNDRPPGYTYADYLADFNTWKNAIWRYLPSGVKLMGPAWGNWFQDTANFMTNESSVLGLFTLHDYPVAPSPVPPADILLTEAAATQGPNAVKSAGAILKTTYPSIPFRMGEFNSLYGSGDSGVSNVFASALWAIDTLFEYVNVGLDGVNFESSGNWDDPFPFTYSTVKGKTVFTLTNVNPLYYGMLLFQAATAGGASLVPVTLSTSANLKAWATTNAVGTTRLVIINKDEAQTGSASVSFPGYTRATVLRLVAPSYQSTTGVTFGGQTVNANGIIEGTQTSETFLGTNGVFQIPMPITSAAMVTFAK